MCKPNHQAEDKYDKLMKIEDEILAIMEILRVLQELKEDVKTK